MAKIILTNQHSDNRGDESAVVGVIHSLRKQFGSDAQVIIYLQSGSKMAFLSGVENVLEKGMLMGVFQFLEMGAWLIFKSLGMDIRFLASKKMREFLKEHEDALCVISSCGGPYIGDVYINHEIFHIFHMLIPQLLGKPTAFYAPSMGPFKNKFMNKFRRMMLERIGVIALRDPISYDYVNHFLGRTDKVHLTTDSCLSYDVDRPAKPSGARKIGVTPIDYAFPLAQNQTAKKAEYEQAIVGALNAIMEKDMDVVVEFFPQLYGKWKDVPYIERIIGKLNFPERTFVFSDEKSGVAQQEEISQLEYMIACRYHSAIFACKANVPVVCVVYEHKASGFMESVGLADYCLDIYNISSKLILDRLRILEVSADKIKVQLPTEIERLQKKADLTAQIIYEYVSNW